MHVRQGLWMGLPLSLLLVSGGAPCCGQAPQPPGGTVVKPATEARKVIPRADGDLYRKVQQRIAEVDNVCKEATDVSIPVKARVSALVRMLKVERADPQPGLQERHGIEDISCGIQRHLISSLSDVKDLDALQEAIGKETDPEIRDRLLLAMSATVWPKPDARQEAAMAKAIEVLTTSEDLSLRPSAAFALGNAADLYPKLREKAIAALKKGLWVKYKPNPKIKTSSPPPSDNTPVHASDGLRKWKVPVMMVDGVWVAEEATP